MRRINQALGQLDFIYLRLAVRKHSQDTNIIEGYGSESTKLSSIVVKLFFDYNERSLDIPLINQPGFYTTTTA